MKTENDMYYLLIRPVAEDLDELDDVIEFICKVTKLDHATVRLKFTGSALQVLKVGKDIKLLQKISDDLTAEGFASLIISRSETRKSIRPKPSCSLEVGSNSLDLVNRQQEVVLSMDKTKSTLVVISTMQFDGMQGKNMARQFYNKGKGFLKADEKMQFIYRHKPVMDIYHEGAAPVRIDGVKFNFSSLEGENKGTVALNFPVILDLIKKNSSQVFIDDNFGEANLPFILDLQSKNVENKMNAFITYSNFIFKAVKMGIFEEKEESVGQAAVGFGVPITEADPLAMLTLGAVKTLGLNGRLKESKRKANKKKEIFKKKEQESKLPPSPVEAVSYRTYGITNWLSNAKHFYHIFIELIDSMGPPILMYPLAIFSVISFKASQSLANPRIFFAGIITFGVMVFVYSFTLLKRKRAIENCPTAKVGSMPMGGIEVTGYVKPKYYLRAPYSQTECVYYSYSIYKTIYINGKYQSVLTEWGNSGRIPFYLEDDTGKVLVNPDDAVIKTSRKQTFSENMLASIFASESYGSKDISASPRGKVVEKLIPTGQFLYVTGYAGRHKMRSEEKKDLMREKIRRLKKDKNRMKKYDRDQDGKISVEEWERAGKDLVEEVLLEGVGGRGDSVAIKNHPTGGLFFISDKKEDTILTFLAIQILWFLVLGFGSIIAGIYCFLKYQ